MSTLILRRLTAASNKMLANLIPLAPTPSLEKLKDDLEKLRRRCHIMSLLYDRNVIAVAGLQGVGKSTMISNLYDFTPDNSPFLQNQGQGETLPVLVTESDQPERYFVHKVIEEEGILKIKREELIDKKEFQRISHEYNSDDLLLEVTVPLKVFNDDFRSFLLLPGFQHGTDYLKELTYTALRSSSNCLVLFYQTKYADKSNSELINTLKEEFSESSPIFVITWSDNEDSNENLLKTVKHDLGIKEEDRIIRSGVPGPSGWKESIIKAIEKYGLPKAKLTEMQKNNINKLIGDYNRIIGTIQVELRRLNIDKSNREYDQVDGIIKEIQKQRMSIKENLSRYLKKSFSSYFGEVENAVTNEILNKYSGWDGVIESFSDFFKSNVEIRENLKKLVQNCIDTANVNSPKQELQLVINRIVNEEMQKHKIVMNLPTEENVQHDIKLLMCGNSERQSDESRDDAQVQKISESALNDIYMILHPEKKHTDFSKDLLFNVKLLPILALESFRINSIIADNSHSKFPNEALSEQQTLIEMYQNNKKEVAIGVGLLFGFDIMEGDGIDLFGLLQHNAINGGAAMATATFHWVAASIAGAAMMLYMYDQLIKSVDKKEKTARIALESMKNYFIEDILLSYDNNMQRYEEIVRDCLIRRHGLAEEFAHLQNCYSALTDLRTIKTEIEKANRVEQ